MTNADLLLDYPLLLSCEVDQMHDPDIRAHVCAYAYALTRFIHGVTMGQYLKGLREVVERK